MMRKKNLILCICVSLAVFWLSGCGGKELPAFSDEVLTPAASGEDFSYTGKKNLKETFPEASTAENETAGEAAETGDASAGSFSTAGMETDRIVVYVCGAVKEPGVISLAQDSRVNDAVLAAGGLADEASAESVNLAAKIADGEMIYIPTREEAEQGNFSQQDPGKSAGTVGNGSSLININTAGIDRLCELPGIGESRAQEIITYREKNGAFQSKEDIMNVSGIKEGLYSKICDLISVR